MVTKASTIHQVHIVAGGDFELSADVVVALGDALDGRPGLVDPIITLDTRSRRIEVSLEAEGATFVEAEATALSEVGEALRALGVVDSWRPARPREAVLSRF